MNEERDIALRELKMLRDSLRASHYKRLADDADTLLQSFLDFGLVWTRLIPAINELKTEAYDTLSGRRTLPYRK